MINIFLSYLIGIGPYVAIAIGCGFVCAVAIPFLWKRPEKWLFFSILFFGVVAIGGGASAGSEGSLYKQITWGGLFLFSALKLLNMPGVRIRDILGDVPPLLLLVLFYCLVSIAWSPMHYVSLKRVIQIFGVLIIAVLVVRDMQSTAKGRPLIEQLAFPASLLLIIGLLISTVSPSTGFDQDHALRAISSHKNTWGQFSLICVLVFGALAMKSTQPVWRNTVLLLISIFSLFASKSSTNLLAFMLVATFALVWLLFRRGGKSTKAAFFGALLCLIAISHVYIIMTGRWPHEYVAEIFFSVTGKNSTLSGRVHLWELMFNEIWRHPWFGTGYGGFWSETEGASRWVTARLNWGPPTQAHSGYIDLINELGWIGFALVMAMLFDHAKNLVRLSQLGSASAVKFHAALFIAALVVSYSETFLLRTNHFFWVVLCISFVEVRFLLRGLELRNPRAADHRVAPVGAL